MQRYGYCIFCDDIRTEPGEKLSFIGCYNSAMFVKHEFPLSLPKLCVHFNVFSPADQPYKSLKVRCYLPGEDEPVSEESIDVPPLQDQIDLLNSLPKDQPMMPFIVVAASLIFMPCDIKAPGMIHVRALINDGPAELHLGSLQVS
jgi:hypothetical protein